MLDITHLMKELARYRPVFHSEADFQHALAWRIHEEMPDCEVRLEYKPFLTKRLYLDLWLPNIGVAMELKYYTGKLHLERDDESFALLDQSAQDIRRYDFLKDIQRLEQLSKLPQARAGIAVLLTNDPTYWKSSSRPDTVDVAFRLHDGRKITGQMAWAERASDGTTKNRKESILLRGSYDLRWHNYANLGNGPNRLFRYLVVRTSC